MKSTSTFFSFLLILLLNKVYEIDLTSIKAFKKQSVIYPFVLFVPLLVHTFFPKNFSGFLADSVGKKFWIAGYFAFVPLLSYIFQFFSDAHLNIVRILSTLGYIISYNYDYFLFRSKSLPKNTWNMNFCIFFINMICVTYFSYLSKFDSLIYIVSFSLFGH